MKFLSGSSISFEIFMRIDIGWSMYYEIMFDCTGFDRIGGHMQSPARWGVWHRHDSQDIITVIADQCFQERYTNVCRREENDAIFARLIMHMIGWFT